MSKLTADAMRAKRRRRVRRLLAVARPRMFLLLAVVIGLPTLLLPRTLDDHWFHAYLARTPRLAPVLRPWWDLFGFYPDAPGTRFLRDLGVAPWWTDETLRIRFFRPLSSALHAIDETIGGPPALAHAHSVLLYGLVAAAAAMLFSEVIRRRAPAALASVLFVIASSHGFPVASISSRNMLVATLGALVAVRLHVRAIRGGRVKLAMLSAAVFAGALLGGEAALGTAGFVFAAEVTLARDSLRSRASRLAPHAAAFLLWYALYRTFGFGVRASGFYLDPGSDFAAWASALPGRLASLAGSMLSGLPAEIFIAVPEPARAFVALLFAGMAIAVVGLLAGVIRREPAAQFFLLGGVLACVPPCGTLPSIRVLMLASTGAAGLLGIGLVAAWRSASRARRIGGTVLAVLHGPVALLLFALTAASLALIEGRLARASTTIDELGLAGERCVVFVHAPILVNGYFGVQRDTLGLPNPKHTLTLSGSEHPIAVRSEGDAVIVDAPEGFYAPGDAATLTRSTTRPFVAGTAIEHPCGRIAVETVSVHGVPTRIRFMPREPAPMVRWVEGRFERVIPPAGEALQIGRTPPL